MNLSSGCGKSGSPSKSSRSDFVFNRHNAIVDEAVEILQRNSGDQEKAEKELRAYVAKHRPEIRGIIVEGKGLRETMSEAELAKFEERARSVREPRENRIVDVLKAYPNPDMLRNIMRNVMQ